MPSEAQQEHEVYRLMAERLMMLGENTTADEHGVWFTDWPTICLSNKRLLALPAAGDGDNWLARLDPVLRYNMMMPETEVITRTIGLGGEPGCRDSRRGRCLDQGCRPGANLI